jgi:hypothetical protein
MTTEVVCGRAEIGVVEDVEKIRSSLEGNQLVEFGRPPPGQVDIRGAESAQGISSQISLRRPVGFHSVSVPDPRTNERFIALSNSRRTAGAGVDSRRSLVKSALHLRPTAVFRQALPFCLFELTCRKTGDSLHAGCNCLGG